MRKFFVSIITLLVFASPLLAQAPAVQEQISDAKQAAVRNKQALATYTWQEQQTVSVKGEVKSQTLSQVLVGPDGQSQKTPLGPTAAPAPPQRGPIRNRIKEKKTDEFKDYAQQVGALVHAYSHPDPEKMQQAFQQGNVSLGSAGPGQVALTFTSYLKPGDSFTLVLGTQDKSMQSVQVTSYLSDPGDVVSFSAQFAKLKDGTNHVDHSTVNGQQKQLQIQCQNINYQKRL